VIHWESIRLVVVVAATTQSLQLAAADVFNGTAAADANQTVLDEITTSTHSERFLCILGGSRITLSGYDHLFTGSRLLHLGCFFGLLGACEEGEHNVVDVKAPKK